MSINVAEELRKGASYLFDEMGFTILEQEYLADVFGNSYVILSNGDIRIRFIRDRGQVFAEFAALSEPNQWWDLARVLEFLNMAVLHNKYINNNIFI
jgi:hypothetical protein